MNPTTDLTSGAGAAVRAGDAFFTGIPQADTRVGDDSVKIPLFYRDASCLIVVFPAKMQEAARLVGHPSLYAAPVVPGVMTALSIMVFAYHDSDIGPYNELAVAIPAAYGRRPLPFWSLVRQAQRGSVPLFIRRMPVTTEIARATGVELYGYPKQVAGVDFERTDTTFSVAFRDGERRPIALSGRLPRNEGPGATACYPSYTVKDDRPVQAQVLFQSTRQADTVLPRDVELELDTDHPVGQELGALLWSRRPLAVRWAPELRAVLHGPSFLE